MKRIPVLAGIIIHLSLSASAQEFSTAIEDNSFLIEEAYNQEERVVQHISNLLYFPGEKSLAFSFTQEWPVGSRTHQLSYSIPYLSTEANGGGIGDVLINYRYQLTESDEGLGYIAPRLSAILPTGSRTRGLGSGAVGVQVNLPISKRWADSFITHFNAGFTSLFDAKGMDATGTEVGKDLFSFNLGASGIFLLRENFNLLLELLYNRVALMEEGNVTFSSFVIANPGFRFSIDVESLQIVPGLSVPIQMASGPTKVGIFAYLSFEHPF